MKALAAQRVCLSAMLLATAVGFALYFDLILWPSWQARRHRFALMDQMVKAMDSMEEASVGGKSDSLAAELQEITKRFGDAPAPRRDKFYLFAFPFGCFAVALTALLVFRYGIRVAASEALLALGLTGLLYVAPPWLPSKSRDGEFFFRVTLVAATVAGTISAVFAVAKGKVSVYAVVGASLAASAGCGAAIGFVMAMPAWRFGFIVGLMLIGAAVGSIPGTLAGVITGYLYGRSPPVSETPISSGAR